MYACCSWPGSSAPSKFSPPSAQLSVGRGFLDPDHYPFILHASSFPLLRFGIAFEMLAQRYRVGQRGGVLAIGRRKVSSLSIAQRAPPTPSTSSCSTSSPSSSRGHDQPHHNQANLRWVAPLDQGRSNSSTIICAASSSSSSAAAISACQQTSSSTAADVLESGILHALGRCRTALTVLAVFAAWSYLSSGLSSMGPFASLSFAAIPTAASSVGA